MSRLTGWLGGAAARHPWRTIAIWLILIVALFGLKMAFGGQLQDDYTVPGTSSRPAPTSCGRTSRRCPARTPGS